MPQISAFNGIAIRMYWRDHQPPHFHAAYGDHEGRFGIDPIRPIAGGLPLRQRRLVESWAGLHRDELRANWRRAQARVELAGIDATCLVGLGM